MGGCQAVQPPRKLYEVDEGKGSVDDETQSDAQKRVPEINVFSDAIVGTDASHPIDNNDVGMVADNAVVRLDVVADAVNDLDVVDRYPRACNDAPDNTHDDNVDVVANDVVVGLDVGVDVAVDLDVVGETVVGVDRNARESDDASDDVFTGNTAIDDNSDVDDFYADVLVTPQSFRDFQQQQPQRPQQQQYVSIANLSFLQQERSQSLRSSSTFLRASLVCESLCNPLDDNATTCSDVLPSHHKYQTNTGTIASLNLSASSEPPPVDLSIGDEDGYSPMIVKLDTNADCGVDLERSYDLDWVHDVSEMPYGLQHDACTSCSHCFTASAFEPATTTEPDCRRGECIHNN